MVGRLRDALSLRAEFLLIVAGVVVVLCGVVLGYFPKQLEQRGQEASLYSGELLISIAHGRVEPAFEFNDPAFMEESLQELRQHPQVEYVVVRSEGGEVLAAMGEVGVVPPSPVEVSGRHHYREGERLHLQAPMLAGDGRQAVLQLGLSEAGLNAQIRDNRRSSLVLMAVIASLALLLSVALGQGMLSPLLRISRAADLIREGRWARAERMLGSDLPPDSRNEARALMYTFIQMLGSLREQGRQLQAYSGDLEAQVEQQTAALVDALEKAEAATEAKGLFLANMSHEIRTPMSGVLGLVQLLLEDPTIQGEHREMLLTVQSSGNALVYVINDILDYSKLEAGKLAIEDTDFSPAEVLETTTALLCRDAKQRGLWLRVESQDLPSRLQGDPFRIRQILMNLLSNALKFTEEGGVTVRMRGLPLGPGRVQLQLEVEDTGIGISEEVLPRLFQSFNQADNSTTRRYGGTGLGLSISKQLAGLMGGELSVESVLGEGSTFSLSLPCSVAQEQPRSPVQVLVDSALTGRVLVVEDNKVNQLVARRILEKRGVEVVLAGNGAIALDVLAEASFDLVLMDCQMPVMDGLEATRRLRAMGLEVPVVALSANVLEQTQRECFAAGMQGFLGKPIHPQRLDEVLRTYLPEAAERLGAATG